MSTLRTFPYEEGYNTRTRPWTFRILWDRRVKVDHRKPSIGGSGRSSSRPSQKSPREAILSLYTDNARSSIDLAAGDRLLDQRRGSYAAKIVLQKLLSSPGRLSSVSRCAGVCFPLEEMEA